MTKNILIVDDEEEIRELLSYNLEKEGFKVLTAENGLKALEILEEHTVDLILLDVMMPEMDGIEVCHHIRKQKHYDDVIICFLTARNEDYSQIAGLDAGGDDYISKPVKPRVLLSRINALLRRHQIRNSANKNTEDIFIDRDKYVVVIRGEEIQLPKKEFELIALLASKPGFVFERDVILENVWGSDIVVGDRTIDVHIRKLREKIGDEFIKTVKGVGYKFIHQPEEIP
ncbi:MAG: response regulator transcription factor [Brumimicrobium sp.]|nr:response regulator transcription factor [Brumimicrobium sp.]